MKAIKLLGLFFVAVISLQSCTVNVQDDDNYPISLPALMEGSELWYVDYNSTTGNGDVPFLSRAFTISFLNGSLYANNNLVGIGNTGNGYGIKVGYYNFGNQTIVFDHDVYGVYELEVYQVSVNKIKIYDRKQNLAYFLISYNRSSFDYDGLFYDNLHYFLQEYSSWEKVYTSNAGNANAFDAENYLKFLANGNNNRFKSSKDTHVNNINNIYWDYTGNYTVANAANGLKKLNLYYNSNDYEGFDLKVLNDGRIRLYHVSSGTTYEFVGRGFIQFLRSSTQRIKT